MRCEKNRKLIQEQLNNIDVKDSKELIEQKIFTVEMLKELKTN